MSKKEFITILAITLIVALVWVVSDLAHTQSSSKNLPDGKEELEVLNPNFDQQTLNKVSSLATPAPAPSAGPLSSVAPAATPIPTPSLQSPLPSPLKTASPKPSPVATP